MAVICIRQRLPRIWAAYSLLAWLFSSQSDVTHMGEVQKSGSSTQVAVAINIPPNQENGELCLISTTCDDPLHHDKALCVPTGFFEMSLPSGITRAATTRDEQPFSLIPQWRGLRVIESFRGAALVVFRRRRTRPGAWLGAPEIACSRSRLDLSITDSSSLYVKERLEIPTTTPVRAWGIPMNGRA
jgi:hypothetical protein